MYKSKFQHKTLLYTLAYLIVDNNVEMEIEVNLVVQPLEAAFPLVQGGFSSNMSRCVTFIKVLNKISRRGNDA